MMLPTLALPLTLAMAELVSPTRPAGIIGGDPVEPGEHPAVVSMTVGPNLLCTGTLLAPDLVLTAAHCLDQPFLQPSLLEVGLGDSIDAPDQRLGVLASGMHPEFCVPNEDEGCGSDDIHDYAWLRLDGSFAIDPALLPPVVTDEALHHQLVRKGAELELVGFGTDDVAQQGRKRTVLVDLTEFSPSGQELRAGADGHDSCSGDSGGPALARLPDGGSALVGVLSRGSDPCGKGGIYGAPLPALCWIRDDSGMDLVPSGCEDCSCVDLTPREEESRGCSVSAERPPARAWWLGLGLLVLGRLRTRRSLVP